MVRNDWKTPRNGQEMVRKYKNNCKVVENVLIKVGSVAKHCQNTYNLYVNLVFIYLAY